MAARHQLRHSVEPPRWLASLEHRVARLKTAEDWLRVLTKLQRFMAAYDLVEWPDIRKGEPLAFVMPSGDVGHFSGPFDHFLVDLSAPSAMLTQEFRRWLEQKRQDFPSSVRKRGTPALNDCFDARKFEDWRQLRIVEYGALLIWRERKPHTIRKSITKSTIGSWIKRYGSNDRKKTMDGLTKALISLPALAVQAGVEKSP